MRTVADLREDLLFSRGLGDIIDVLKTAAMIQFRTFQTKDAPSKEFLKELDACFSLASKENISHPYLLERKNLSSAIVVVTSDEGFLGELNTVIVNAAMDQRKSREDEIIVLGERGARYLEDMDQNFVFFPGVSDEINYKEVQGVNQYLLSGYNRKFGRVLIVYPEFISLTSQRIEILKLLPYHLPSPKVRAGSFFLEEILLEPSSSEVLKVLIELWSSFKLLEIFWSSKQSEYAARIMHLEGSTQELTHLNQKLAQEYFRQVHTLRDKAIREISASKILLGKGKKLTANS